MDDCKNFIEHVKNIDISMVFVSGGSFFMGNDRNLDVECGEDEIPKHNVVLPDFFISKYLINICQFGLFISDSGYLTDAEKKGWAWCWKENNVGEYDWVKVNGVNWRCREDGSIRHKTEENYPVLYVSYNDAKAFCAWLKEITGKNYRLPKESEWEFAARGGLYSNGFKYSGSNNPLEVAWHNDNSSESHRIGMLLPNELGIFDMSGNAREWTDDWYQVYCDNYNYNNLEIPMKKYKVLRGGGWNYSKRCIRVSNRNHGMPDSCRNNDGFRIAL